MKRKIPVTAGKITIPMNKKIEMTEASTSEPKTYASFTVHMRVEMNGNAEDVANGLFKRLQQYGTIVNYQLKVPFDSSVQEYV